MNGDPNNVRDDVLGALALLEAALADRTVQGAPALQIAFACAALRRANEKLRSSCYACGGYGCDLCGDLAPVIPLHPGHSIKVGA